MKNSGSLEYTISNLAEMCLQRLLRAFGDPLQSLVDVGCWGAIPSRVLYLRNHAERHDIMSR